MSIAPSDFSVEVAGRCVPVAVRRHPRARRLRLRFDRRSGHLWLTLPPRGDMTSAQCWVGQQHAWIARQIARESGESRVADGTVLPFCGQSLNICWSAAAPRTPMLVGDRLEVGGPEEAVGRRVARWLADRALQRLEPETRQLAASAALPLTGVSVGDPRTRWGSCAASGRIRYSWRLIMMPDMVRASIVAHEVAHLRHMNHGPHFHRFAEELLGEHHGPARDWLKAHGASILRWDFG